MLILDGKTCAKNIQESLKINAGANRPGLAVIQIGNDKSSTIYTKMKTRACQRVKFFSVNYHFKNNESEDEILQTIKELNTDDKIHGILIQLPLPKEYNEERLLEAVSPYKDVDGFHSFNTNRLMSRNRPKPYFIPATTSGILWLLKHYNIPIRGKKAVIVGHSNIVGMPTAHALLQEWATVTICHIETTGLQEICRNADILVSATGTPGLITKNHVKYGATVIDVGITKIEYIEDGCKKSKIVGDVCPDVKEVAGALTPVPGGVGPMTIALLLKNTLDAYKQLL